MAAKRWALIGLIALMVAASVTLTRAQNSFLPQTLPEQSEVPISPVTPGTGPGSLSNQSTGLNPLTGLPCSGQGSLAISGAGGLSDTAGQLPDTSAPPDTGAPIISLPSLNSVFGTSNTLGSC